MQGIFSSLAGWANKHLKSNMRFALKLALQAKATECLYQHLLGGRNHCMAFLSLLTQLHPHFQKCQPILPLSFDVVKTIFPCSSWRNHLGCELNSCLVCGCSCPADCHWCQPVLYKSFLASVRAPLAPRQLFPRAPLCIPMGRAGITSSQSCIPGGLLRLCISVSTKDAQVLSIESLQGWGRRKMFLGPLPQGSFIASLTQSKLLSSHSIWVMDISVDKVNFYQSFLFSNISWIFTSQ